MHSHLLSIILWHINTFIITTLAASYPGWTSVFSVGTSYEGRDLNVLKINVGGTTKTKGIWFNGGIHAREWISPATVLWMVNQLLSTYSTDSDAQTILDTFEVCYARFQCGWIFLYYG